MTHSPLTRLQKFRLLSLIPLYFMIVGLFLQPITEILPGLSTLIREPDFLITDYFLIGGIGTSFINAGLLTLSERRRSHASQYCPYLFSGYGDGRTYDHIQLPDVRVFPVWKESSEYLGDPARCIPLLPLPQETHVQLHLHRFLRHQPVPDHHADHVYLTPALRSPAHHKTRSRTHHRLRAAAVIHPCSLFPQRLLPV